MSYSTEVLADSPYRYFRMGQASGTEPDETGSATVLDVNGTTLPTRDVTGALASGDDGAMQFNGTTAAASVPLSLSDTSVVTVEAWVWWNAYANDDDLLLEYTPNWNSPPKGGFIVDMNNSTGSFEANTVSIGFDAPDGQRSRWVFPRSALPAAGWHHFVLVMDQGAATNNGFVAKVYVDGASVSLSQVEGPPVPGTPPGFANSTLYLMSRQAGSLFGAGKLDELAIYKSELSSARVAAHYAAGIASGSFVVASTRMLVWDVRTAASSTRKLVWDVRNQISSTRKLVWDLSTSASSTRQLAWDIVGQVSSVRKLVWDIANQVSSARKLVWDVRVGVSSARKLVWDLLPPAVSTRLLVWDVNSLVQALVARLLALMGYGQ